MGKAIMGAVVSLDGFIADSRDEVGPLFDWLATGDVTWSFPGSDDEFRTTQASADFMRSHYRDVAAVVIGRRLFDMTNGWNGKPAAGEHVFVKCQTKTASGRCWSRCRVALRAFLTCGSRRATRGGAASGPRRR
jgi:dihydrofolate reductase